MTDNEQIDHFAKDVNALVDRYRKEFDLCYASAVGVLQMKIYSMCDEAKENSEEENEQ